MSIPLRVLMIEDAEDDALLILRELRRGGYDPLCEIYQEKEEFAEALSKVWDLILCDYILPTFDAMEALKIYHDSGLEVPFIVVSGNIGEEIAVATMKAGAHDYIMKDHLVRLVPAIERELRDARERILGKNAKEELSLAKFATDHVSDAISWMDEQGIIFYANETAGSLLNYPHGELIGRNAASFGFVDYSAKSWEAFVAFLKQRRSYTQEARVCTKDGRLLMLEVRLNFLEYKDRNYICAFARDISQKKQAEEAALRHQARIEALLRTAAHLNSMLELQAILNAVCEEAYMAVDAFSVTLSLFNQQEMVLRRITGIGPLADDRKPEDSIIPFSVLEEMMDKPILLVPDVSVKPNIPNIGMYGIKSAAFVSLTYNGHYIGCLNVFFKGERNFQPDEIMFLQGLADQTASAITNARLFDEIKSGQEQMRKLTAQVVTAQEEERRRISRELHDEAGQALTALKIHLELILDDLPIEMITVRARIEEAAVLTGATLEQIRILAQDLRPPALDTIGINLTLEHYCRAYSKRVHLPVYYQGHELYSGGDAQNICLYRVLQEALTNVAKHACAREVKVRLRLEGSTAVLKIEDDGEGFVESELENSNGRGVGLLGMRERIEALNGTLSIESRPGRGTILVVRIPWEGEGIKDDTSYDCR
ncbi:MAG TPA: ATP-binding protein [Bacillota bacterium]|nr:ATP-binding protein [Bacillota bacterium]